MNAGAAGKVFDYRALRLLIGLIALFIPVVTSILSGTQLVSISASYHTEARDAFVGMLFVVSAFLWAYNGHSSTQMWFSKIASIATVFVAIFPTSCMGCDSSLSSVIHGVASAVLFLILSYFCFSAFRTDTKGKAGKKGMRSRIYYICGCIMIGALLAIVFAKITLSRELVEELRIVYYGEALALFAFGTAWIVAGKWIRLFVDEEEALHLFRS